MGKIGNCCKNIIKIENATINLKGGKKHIIHIEAKHILLAILMKGGRKYDYISNRIQ